MLFNHAVDELIYFSAIFPLSILLYKYINIKLYIELGRFLPVEKDGLSYK